MAGIDVSSPGRLPWSFFVWTAHPHAAFFLVWPTVEGLQIYLILANLSWGWHIFWPGGVRWGRGVRGFGEDGMARKLYGEWTDVWALSSHFFHSRSLNFVPGLIIVIMSCRQHGYPRPSLATSPYHPSLLAGLQGYIPYPHVAALCMFELVVLLLLGHVRGP